MRQYVRAAALGALAGAMLLHSPGAVFVLSSGSSPSSAYANSSCTCNPEREDVEGLQADLMRAYVRLMLLKLQAAVVEGLISLNQSLLTALETIQSKLIDQIIKLQNSFWAEQKYTQAQIQAMVTPPSESSDAGPLQ